VQGRSASAVRAIGQGQRLELKQCCRKEFVFYTPVLRCNIVHTATVDHSLRRIMAVAQSNPGLGHFSRLSQAVYLHQPNTTTSSTAPGLILLAGWMDASIRNVAKYTAGYEKLYPSAKIVVILTSSTDVVFRSNAANLNRIAPVLEILYTLPPDARFLVHSFSNGGALTMSLIAREFQAKSKHQLPMAAFILDSSPGKATLKATIRAFAVGLPKFFVLRWFILSVISVSYWLLKFLYWITARTDVLEKMREELNTPSMFRLEAPRLYIYSIKDHVVAWQEIEEHVGEAKRSGYKVDSEKFSDTGHAGHLIGNDGRYWGCVRRLWDTVV
jgi:hypothetical protein